eukprot:Hpha_TRINITY_DN16715_c0_g1::TRINITY_DN16715_c0_g1_i1::g.76202::m.76202/K07222/K07222; putative flavoprotein involved in K+ transport
MGCGSVKGHKEVPMSKVNTIIIGGGHCGTNLACILSSQEKTDYVVLEKGKVFDQWKNHRWEGFQLNTPLAYSMLYGEKPEQDPRAMARPLAEDIGRWEKHLSSTGVRERLRENCTVVKCVKLPDGLLETTVECADGGPTTYVSHNVVCCTGTYHVRRIHPCAEKVPSGVKQFQGLEFKGESQLNPGGVLVVGGGQTGIQLADILSKKGRDVYECLSMVPGTVRSWRGEDVFFWMDRIKFTVMPKEALDGMPPEGAKGMRYGHIPITGSSYPISHHSLHRQGVKLLGSLESIEGDKIVLKGNRQQCVGLALESYKKLPGMCEEYVRGHPEEKFGEIVDEDEWVPVPELSESPGPLELSFQTTGITNIIWAMGSRPGLDWIQIEGVKEDFDPVSKMPHRMESPVPGLFFSGFPWLRTVMSHNVLGFTADQLLLADMLR